MSAIDRIRARFEQTGSPARIPKLRGGPFFAELETDGVSVDNLGNQPFLPWAVFEETVALLARKGGSAARGDAMKSRLGEPGLPFDSVEGRVADRVYGKEKGETVFRRVTPIACILIWAGVCRAAPGILQLRDPAND